MESIEGKLYFIKDKFIEKYNPKYHLMENKETGTKRPTYFCFRDKIDKNILWFVPMSSKYDKYLKLYNDIKSKKGIEPNNFVFARKLAGKKAVFLIQNMFPVTLDYIESQYMKNKVPIKVSKQLETEIIYKANKVLNLYNHGMKNIVFPDIDNILNKLLNFNYKA